MKKVAYILIAIFGIGLLASCASSHTCAAYGNTYQSSGYNKR
ncbi:MAG: hypothetical protein ACPGRC_04770 [Salibacteraceae bacterium]